MSNPLVSLTLTSHHQHSTTTIIGLSVQKFTHCATFLNMTGNIIQISGNVQSCVASSGSGKTKWAELPNSLQLGQYDHSLDPFHCQLTSKLCCLGNHSRNNLRKHRPAEPTARAATHKPDLVSNGTTIDSSRPMDQVQGPGHPTTQCHLSLCAQSR